MVFEETGHYLVLYHELRSLVLSVSASLASWEIPVLQRKRWMVHSYTSLFLPPLDAAEHLDLPCGLLKTPGS